ncbi:MAG: VWA domain-containing protein [Proteobacteria bacterium]|nr:VWA domain-containing protein [Pseudomonadota bacterium]
MRSLLIVLAGLVLADPRLPEGSDRVNLFFCMDVSDSIAEEAKETAMDFMGRAVKGMKEEDQAGLIVFGKRASLEAVLKKDFKTDELKSQVNTGFTNIYEALQLAIGKLTRKGTNRIVLFSDGNQTLRDSEEMAYLASSLGIEIYPAPLTPWFHENETYIEKLESPRSIPLETPFEVSLLVTSTGETEGQLILLRNGRLMANQRVRLQRGKNVFRFADTIKEQGLYLYRSVVNAKRDTVYQNNEGLAFTHGTRKSEVLYVSDEKKSQTRLARTLTDQGFYIAHRTPENLPDSLNGLLDYDAIILDNVSARSMALGTLENLEKYVKDMGGGLIMVGGDKSFGAGYYRKTPVEKALPVYMEVPTTLDFPSLCLVLVVDKSSSMAEYINNKSKLEGAKMAAFSVVEMLNPIDKVGVLAFDSEFQWIVPITRAEERKKIARSLMVLKEEGGTNLYPGLAEAFRVLKTIPAVKKHVIALSDGITDKMDFQPLIGAMRNAHITVSTVAVGNDSDVKLMRSIAQWGGGRSYYTNDAEKIPRIFVSETQIVARRVVSERKMQPETVIRSEMLVGVPVGELPLVYGLDIAHPKPGASVIFNTGEGPLLSAWRYGLGRSAAFTSDLSGRWCKDWLKWDHYGDFVSKMVGWVQRKATDRQYSTTIDREEDRGRFTVDVTNKQHRFVNHLNLELRVLSPSKSDLNIALDQTAPGRYSGKFPAEEIGEYYLGLYGKSEEGVSRNQTYGFGIPYAEEFKSRSANLPLLTRLAQSTNGRLLTLEDDPASLFAADPDKKEYGLALWPFLLTAFLLLLVADVAARKLFSLNR